MKLLTGPQRKALQTRITVHARKLDWNLRQKIKTIAEPAKVKKARLIVEAWEESQENQCAIAVADLEKEVKQIGQNLLFDSVESSLDQVQEFEGKTCEDFI